MRTRARAPGRSACAPGRGGGLSPALTSLRSTRLPLLRERGESGARSAAGPPAPWGHCGTPPPPNGNCGVQELTKLGEVGPGGGTWGPRRRARAQLTLKLERTCSACGTATAASAAGDHPRRPSPYTPKSQDAGRVGRAEGQREGRRPAGRAGRAGADAPNKSAFANRGAAKRRGPVGSGAQSRARFWPRAQDPGGVGGGEGGPRAGRRRRYLP